MADEKEMTPEEAKAARLAAEAAEVPKMANYQFPVNELFEVAEGKTAADLKAAVVALQQKGYKPEGSILFDGEQYVQGMVQR